MKHTKTEAHRRQIYTADNLLSSCTCDFTDQVQELELSVDIPSLDRLLEFLGSSFQGGTDVDKPLELSLERLKDAKWAQVGLVAQPLGGKGNSSGIAICLTARPSAKRALGMGFFFAAVLEAGILMITDAGTVLVLGPLVWVLSPPPLVPESLKH